MFTIQTRARRAFAAAGFFFLFLSTANGQPGVAQTFSLSAPMTVVRNAATNEYSFSFLGRINISGLPRHTNFQAAGKLTVGPGSGPNDIVTAYGLISSGTDSVIAFKMDVASGYIATSLGAPTRDNIYMQFLNGSNGVLSGQFAKFSVNSANVTVLDVSGSATIYNPGSFTGAAPILLGSVPHVAVGGGWKTTFYLTQYVSVTPADVEVRLYSDDGSPMSVAWTAPDGATRRSVWSGSVYGPGVVAIVAAAAEPTETLRTGSAHIWTTGIVEGYAVYRYMPTGQESVVPLQRASQAQYSVPYDNTDGTSTGVAITNISGSVANVQISVAGDPGVYYNSIPVDIPKNGHLSFVVSERFPQTAGQRGTITFSSSTWSLGSINVTGIRAAASGAFTSLPVISR